MKSLLKKIGNACLDIIAPVRCVNCEKQGRPLCCNCLDLIDWVIFEQEPPTHLTSLTSMARFSSVMTDYVHEMKFEPNKECAIYAGELLYKHTWWKKTDVVTGIPVSFWRKLNRGFNQAELIGKKFSQLSQIPYVNLLEKNIHTSAQASVHSKEERASRLKDHFIFIGEISIPPTVTLIDDVCTTGATLSACAEVLLKAGAKEVHALTLAREM